MRAHWLLTIALLVPVYSTSATPEVNPEPVPVQLEGLAPDPNRADQPPEYLKLASATSSTTFAEELLALRTDLHADLRELKASASKAGEPTAARSVIVARKLAFQVDLLELQARYAEADGDASLASTLREAAARQRMWFAKFRKEQR